LLERVTKIKRCVSSFNFLFEKLIFVCLELDETCWLEKRYITEVTVINRISPILKKEKFPKKMEEKKINEQI
jgi:hypothetical protein